VNQNCVLGQMKYIILLWLPRFPRIHKPATYRWTYNALFIPSTHTLEYSHVHFGGNEERYFRILFDLCSTDGKVVQDSLESRGLLEPIRAQLRAQVFHLLDDQVCRPVDINSPDFLISGEIFVL
jgi:hypothetical protein